MLKVVPLKIQHAFDLAPNLRPEDKIEVQATTNVSEEQTLVYGALNSAPGYTVLTQDGIVACFGVVPTENENGLVWLLGSGLIEKIKVSFLKETIKYTQQMLYRYKILYNYVDANYEKSIKWLKWSGYQFAPEPWLYGIEQKPFYFFWKERGC